MGAQTQLLVGVNMAFSCRFWTLGPSGDLDYNREALGRHFMLFFGCFLHFKNKTFIHYSYSGEGCRVALL